MKYIDAEKLIAEIERRMKDYNVSIEKYYNKQNSIKAERDSWKWAECKWFLSLIVSLQQEQPDDNLTNIAYWLEHFGMPKENIENCITQIAQGYGACRYLEGIQHGAEAVNELAQQEQPSLPSNLDEAAREFAKTTFTRPLSDTPEQELIIIEPDKLAGFKAGAEWMAGQISKAE